MAFVVKDRNAPGTSENEFGFHPSTLHLANIRDTIAISDCVKNTLNKDKSRLSEFTWL